MSPDEHAKKTPKSTPSPASATCRRAIDGVKLVVKRLSLDIRKGNSSPCLGLRARQDHFPDDARRLRGADGGSNQRCWSAATRRSAVAGLSDRRIRARQANSRAWCVNSTKRLHQFLRRHRQPPDNVTWPTTGLHEQWEMFIRHCLRGCALQVYTAGRRQGRRAARSRYVPCRLEARALDRLPPLDQAPERRLTRVNKLRPVVVCVVAANCRSADRLDGDLSARGLAHVPRPNCRASSIA